MRIRVSIWLFAAIFLVAFSWIGVLAGGFGDFFKGLEIVMPLNTKLVVRYGPIACPVIGAAAAIALLFSERHCRGSWVQPGLILALVFLAIYMFRSLLFSYCGPTPRLNTAVAVDGGIAVVAQVQNERPAATEPRRWVKRT